MRYLSVADNDSDILKALSNIHLKGEWYDLDCTYSKGVFYKNCQEPKIKSDIAPLFDDVVQADCRELSFIDDNTLKSIVFDPPFLFRKRNSANNDKISKRFSYFKSFDELMTMYVDSMICFNKKLKKGGHLFFKCQDMTDGKFYCTHFQIIRMAEVLGYELKDIMIKATNKKLQRDAKQQNCVAKVHSYWLVFRKVEK